jgi:alpha-amylase
MSAVTFVDNPDTDLSFGENVIWNKLLGYALILTAEGYPAVYYKDYSTDAGCYGLKHFIDNLIWIHENLAFGDTLTRWGNDQQVYVFERQGYPGLLVALNNDQYNAATRTVATNFGANVQLHDYTGKHGDIWTNGAGQATFTIPRNENGQSYLCFSRTGYTQAFALNRRTTSQTFFGAADLDTPPAENGHSVQAGRFWCAQGSAIDISLEAATGQWGTAAEIVFHLTDAEGQLLGSETLTATRARAQLRTVAKGAGWYTLNAAGQGLGAEGAAYEATVIYTGTQGLGA